MRARAVVQVVPRLPPAEGGVGDYAAILADGLAERCEIATRFLVADRSRPAGAAPGGATAIVLERRAGALCAQLAAAAGATPAAPAAVLVHYANYGYADRGCPRWLVAGLRRWRSRPGSRLVTIFHEVYASGPPRSSSFWLSPLQRRLAASLARASDRVITNLELYRDLLARWVPRDAIAVLPVFSTTGELASPAPLAGRRRRLVVFGGPGGRARAYGEQGAAMAAACAELGIEEIVDVGASLASAGPEAVGGVAVVRLGALAATAVSGLLADSLAGFVAHTPSFLGKSTVFAAYCAHGALPVAACREAGETRVWTPGCAAGEPALQAAADAAHAWYSGHCLGRQAATIGSFLGGQAA